MPDSVILRGYVLSFDYGLRRIGVAVGQSATRTASPLETIAHRNTPDWDAIDRLIKEWSPQMFVVGLPLDKHGKETKMSRAARKFASTMTQRYDRKSALMDERLSSSAAQSRFQEGRASGKLKRKHISQLDAVAAQIILENWLQSQPETIP